MEYIFHYQLAYSVTGTFIIGSSLVITYLSTIQSLLISLLLKFLNYLKANAKLLIMKAFYVKYKFQYMKS